MGQNSLNHLLWTKADNFHGRPVSAWVAGVDWVSWILEQTQNTWIVRLRALSLQETIVLSSKHPMHIDQFSHSIDIPKSLRLRGLKVTKNEEIWEENIKLICDYFWIKCSCLAQLLDVFYYAEYLVNQEH